jgi:hypothetical protein
MNMADLTIVIAAHPNEDGTLQTMSSYEIPPSGKIIFTNASETDSLEVSAKKGYPPPPFCASNNSPKSLPITIAAKGSAGVHVCKPFDGKDFFYTAKIGDALAEDPIVIIEKKQSIVFDPASFFIGVGVAAILTYLIMRSRTHTLRPQQG